MIQPGYSDWSQTRFKQFLKKKTPKNPILHDTLFTKEKWGSAILYASLDLFSVTIHL